MHLKYKNKAFQPFSTSKMKRVYNKMHKLKNIENPE